MKHNILFIAALSGFIALSSCNDDDFVAGNPQMDVVEQTADAFYGDSLPFTIKASDVDVPLSTLKAQLYYGEEKVSETVIRTKVSGADYTGKIYVPYLKNTPNGKATLKYVLQNTSLTKSEKEQEVTLARPDFSYVTLVSEDGTEYRLERTSLYNYTAHGDFPAKINGVIVTPKYGTNGNELTFGWNGSEIELNGSQNIPFSSTATGEYDITFNTLNFEASPFAKILMNGEEMTLSDTPDVYTIDASLTSGQTITFEGITNLSEWWIDPDYLELQDDGSYKFLPISGKYRITANGNRSYFIIEVLDSDGNLASLASDGTGAIWVIGEKVGKPSVSSNEVGWVTENALCMAPVATGKYQLTLTAGRTVDASSINFKFFGGAKSWDNAFVSTTISTTSSLIYIGDGNNGRDDGNLGIVDGSSLEVGGIYRFTIDVTGGTSNAVLTVDKIGDETLPSASITINGITLEQLDADNYQAIISLTQGTTLEVTGIDDIQSWYLDPDYIQLSTTGATFLPVSGDYRIKANTALKTFTITRMNGTEEATTNSDGSGGIWLMGWGTGSPSLDNQFGWTPGAAYCMAEISPKVYQFTGYAGPETGSSVGQRLRYDYLSFKFFFQDGWGGEFSGSNALTIASGSEAYIKDAGNFELADGVQLEVGTQYRITIDLTNGVTGGTISFTKL